MAPGPIASVELSLTLLVLTLWLTYILTGGRFGGLPDAPFVSIYARGFPARLWGLTIGFVILLDLALYHLIGEISPLVAHLLLLMMSVFVFSPSYVRERIVEAVCTTGRGDGTSHFEFPRGRDFHFKIPMEELGRISPLAKNSARLVTSSNGRLHNLVVITFVVLVYIIQRLLNLYLVYGGNELAYWRSVYHGSRLVFGAAFTYDVVTMVVYAFAISFTISFLKFLLATATLYIYFSEDGARKFYDHLRKDISDPLSLRTSEALEDIARNFSNLKATFLWVFTVIFSVVKRVIFVSLALVLYIGYKVSQNRPDLGNLGSPLHLLEGMVFQLRLGYLRDLVLEMNLRSLDGLVLSTILVGIVGMILAMSLYLMFKFTGDITYRFNDGIERIAFDLSREDVKLLDGIIGLAPKEREKWGNLQTLVVAVGVRNAIVGRYLDGMKRQVSLFWDFPIRTPDAFQLVILLIGYVFLVYEFIGNAFIKTILVSSVGLGGIIGLLFLLFSMSPRDE